MRVRRFDLAALRNLPRRPVVAGKRGLLRRQSRPGWMQDGDNFVRCPLLGSDWELTDAELSQPAPINLMTMVPRILYQRYNSCGSESAVTGLETIEAISGMDHVPLNPLAVYRYVNGGRDAGSHLDANLRRMQTHGAPPLSVWPYSKGWQAQPSADAMAAALDHRMGEMYEIWHSNAAVRIRRARSAVRLGWVVAAGSRGHAVLIVYDDGTNHPIVANTWSTNWGQGGFGKWDTWHNLVSTYGGWAYRTPRTVRL